MTGGHGHAFGHEADGPDGVRLAAREELKQGAQVLKFMATGGVITQGVEAGAEAYTEAEMRAGTEEAHKKGKHTAAHAQGLTGILNALRAGIDTIEHGAFDRWNDEALDLLRTRFLVPTLAAPEGIVANSATIPDWIVAKTAPIVDIHRDNIHKAWQVDVPIVAGSDAGTPMNPHGRLIRELQLLHEIGLSLAEVLQATTSTAAKALRLAGEVGSLTLGARADLTVWARDPLTDIRAYDKPEAVFLAGKKVGLELLPAV
jgi:imidazolonepropionase-like amidohydrolase